MDELNSVFFIVKVPSGLSACSQEIRAKSGHRGRISYADSRLERTGSDNLPVSDHHEFGAICSDAVQIAIWINPSLLREDKDLIPNHRGGWPPMTALSTDSHGPNLNTSNGYRDVEPGRNGVAGGPPEHLAHCDLEHRHGPTVAEAGSGALDDP